MSELTWQNDWFTWGIGLIIGFPVMTVLLGEIIHRLQRNGRPLADTLRLVRNLVLPVLAFLIFVQVVLGLDPESQFVKLAQTAFLICTINAALSFVNVVLFGEAEADTWRARMPKLLIDLSRLLLVLMGTAVVLAVVWDADLAGVAAALGVGSVVIGLALQDTLGSVMSGIALLFERPFNVGDWLKIGDTVGQVTDINWRAVRLIADSNEMVILPHQAIGREIIRNFSQPLRQHAETIQLGFSYNDPPNVVKQVLKSTALATEGVLEKPPPQSLTVAYDESAITYDITFYIEDYKNAAEVRDSFLSRIWYAARRNNLQPYRFQYALDFDPNHQSKGTSRRFTESVKSMPLLMLLTRADSDLDSLVQEHSVQNFGSGEQVIRVGEVVEFFYIILAGEALIAVPASEDKAQEILTLSRGDFFGATAQFAIEPSPVSITAVQDLEVVVIPSEAINRLLQEHPTLAREIGQTIEVRRKLMIQAKQEGISLTANSSSNYQSVRWKLEDLLRQVSFFARFGDVELRQLIDQGYRKTLSSGETICRENDPGDSFYIILSGSVEVFVESIGKRVAVRQAGEFIGEMSLLLGIPRTATLRASNKTVLFVVDQRNLKSLLKKYRDLADQISEELSKRQETLERLGIKLSDSETEASATDQVRQRIQAIFGI